MRSFLARHHLPIRLVVFILAFSALTFFGIRFTNDIVQAENLSLKKEALSIARSASRNVEHSFLSFQEDLTYSSPRLSLDAYLANPHQSKAVSIPVRRFFILHRAILNGIEAKDGLGRKCLLLRDSVDYFQAVPDFENNSQTLISVDSAFPLLSISSPPTQNPQVTAWLSYRNLFAQEFEQISFHNQNVLLWVVDGKGNIAIRPPGVPDSYKFSLEVKDLFRQMSHERLEGTVTHRGELSSQNTFITAYYPVQIQGFSGLVLASFDRKQRLGALERSSKWLSISFLMALALLFALFWSVIYAIRKSERKLLASESRIRKALEGTGDGVWDWDLIQNTVYFSPGWKQMLGYRDHEISNQLFEWESRVHPDDLITTTQALNDHLNGMSSNYANEHRMMHKDGQWRWILDRGVIAEKLSDGTPTRMVGTHVDITDRVNAGFELSRAREAAESANTAKRAFLANMSHEIRTPLNAVIGLTELLVQTQLSTKQLHLADTIQIAGRSLLSVISDILDFSKIEAGKLNLFVAPMDIWKLVEEVEHLFHYTAEHKGLLFKFRIEPSVPRWITGDPDRIKQIFGNLIGNALKFTEQGSVTASLHAKALASGQLELALMVQDTGIGINEAEQQKLFQKFTQLNESSTRTRGGTGLGLAIAQELTSLMNGRIDVQSTLGVGSCFTVRIQVGDQPAEQPATFGSGYCLWTLFRPDAFLDLKEFLVLWGFKLTEDPTGQHLNGILMDSDERNRLSPAYREGETPLFVFGKGFDMLDQISAISNPGRIQKWENPFRLTEIETSLRRLVRGDLLQTNLPVKKKHLTFNSHILIVEDNAFNCFVATAMLTELGCKSSTAGNGSIALEMLKDQVYDLILMDLQMPVMDGIEATQIIRKFPAPLGNIPIIAVTANAQESDRINCLASGMNDYMAKPIGMATLQQGLERFLTPINSSVAKAVQETSKEPVKLSLVWKKAQLDQIVGTNTSLYMKFIESFLHSATQSFNELDGAIQMEDLVSAERAAHTLKGQAANIGGERMRVLALELETNFRQKKDLNCREMVQALRASFQELAQEFKNQGF
jgi:PAS domain S-box-containing protein